MSRKNEIEILMVEDNEGDIRLATEALSESKVDNKLNIVRDGQDALDYLFKRDKYKDITLPDIIILDLNLPKIDGRQVLKTIKSDANLQNIPVIILTTSKSNDDIKATYGDHANSFITKPLDWDDFIKVIKSIEDFWLTIAKLPSKNG